MTGIVVLKAGDAARMAHLHAAAFTLTEAWSAQSFVDLITQNTSLAFGIEGDLALDALILIQKAAPQAEILTLATAPTARRQGLATRLLTGTLQVLNQHGVTEVLLEVAADNVAACEFYARNQFVENGRRPNYYRKKDGSRIDAKLMSRAVSGHITPERA